VVVLPVPFDATTSYRKGAARGPKAVLKASRQIDLFDLETGRPYEAGIAMLDEPRTVRTLNARATRLAQPIIDAGGDRSRSRSMADSLEKVNALCERLNAWVYSETRALIDGGKLVALLGGDHSVPFGAIRAHAETYPGLGVLHLDAHADLREAYEGFTHSHASIMFNVVTRLPSVARLVQVGIRDLSEAEQDLIEASGGRIRAFSDSRLAADAFKGITWTTQCRRIVKALPRDVYLSFDIDGLDPTLCPHTGTPVPGGLSFQQACALVASVAKSGRRIVGIDLTEVAPGPPIQSNP
jgi:agmatinase